MHAYHELKDMLCRELEDLVKKGELSPGDLDVVDKLTHSIKSLVTIMAMEDSGYSNDDGYRYSGRNRRRDSMGRYASDGSYNRYYDDRYSGRRYSRDEGKDHMVQELESLMEEADSPEIREVMQNALKKLKSM